MLQKRGPEDLSLQFILPSVRQHAPPCCSGRLFASGSAALFAAPHIYKWGCFMSAIHLPIHTYICIYKFKINCTQVDGGASRTPTSNSTETYHLNGIYSCLTTLMGVPHPLHAHSCNIKTHTWLYNLNIFTIVHELYLLCRWLVQIFWEQSLLFLPLIRPATGLPNWRNIVEHWQVIISVETYHHCDIYAYVSYSPGESQPHPRHITAV